MSTLATLLESADYPVYVIAVTLSTGQSFTYTWLCQSSLPGAIDDGAAMAAAQSIRSFFNGGANGQLPAGTTITAMTITRATENSQQRILV